MTNGEWRAADGLELLDADIHRNQLGSPLLFDPVARMRIANDLPRLLVNVILSLTFVGMFTPTPRFHVLPDLRGSRMATLDVLHACDDARQGIRLARCRLNENPMKPDIQSGDEALKQPPGVQINARRVSWRPYLPGIVALTTRGDAPSK